MIKAFLKKLGFTEKEQLIYTMLAELGVQPASVIARRCGLDRITTYKNLKNLVDRNFVKSYYRGGIQHFGIERTENMKEFLDSKINFFNSIASW